MAFPAINHAALQVAHNPADKHLLVHWKEPVNEASLSSHYMDIMDKARRHQNCRYWLLDFHNQQWPSDAHWNWLGDAYAGHAAHVVGHPLFLAYIVAPEHKLYVEGLAPNLLPLAGDKHDFHPDFFDNKLDARAWLLKQQAQDPRFRG